MPGDIRYCTTSDGITVAYRVSGRGDRVLVHTSNALSAALQFDHMAERHAWVEALGQRFTVVEYDSRGTGLSQRDVDPPGFEELARDLGAVVDAVGEARCVLFGFLAGTYPAMLYTNECPDRVSHLILWLPPHYSPDQPRFRHMAGLAVTDWVTFTELFAHEALGWAQGETAHAFAALMRESVSQDMFVRASARLFGLSDDEYARDAAQISVPTLVMQRENYAEFSRFAAPIRGAAIRMFGGNNHTPYLGDIAPVVDAIVEFVEGAAQPAPLAAPGDSENASAATGSMAVILFTDIVDSTPLTERMGDAAFHAASRALDAGIRDAMRDAGGRPVEGKVLGDGVMGVFSSAAQAIEAARRCLDLSAQSELRLHIGLHAGDVIRDGANIVGGAVNVASRICALASGEILLSATVRDLARTSAAVAFDDRGEHTLKGVSEPIHLYAIANPVP